ncbi:MAG: reverse transcriptase domain-containing protein [Candidatus Acidiferrales bacterium]
MREIYEPSHACKIFLPKKSGILRPYTILTVEDQIVYQAMVNVVAERLAPKARNQYLTVTFGHMYAGKASTWFYKPWRHGYLAFNKAARNSFRRGLRFAASFDLTACYDTLDYRVLCHFLRELKCDQEFCEKLKEYLGVWAATDTRIYHSHGIPQGPLASGLLSEVVLRHFDLNYGTKSNVRYLRYVDDIRLFAHREDALRRMLVRLDTLSKDIGLFPQAAKINIHEIKDIEDELKSISNAYEAEEEDEDGPPDQTRVRRAIIGLTRRFTVKSDTKLKYLLARADPSAVLNNRLLRIAFRRPDLIPNIMRYFRKYDRLPSSVSKALLNSLKKEPLYESTTAEIVTTLDKRTSRQQLPQLRRILVRKWRPRSTGTILKTALGRPLFRKKYIDEYRIRYGLRTIPDWWVRAELFSVLSTSRWGTKGLTNMLNEGIRDQTGDVALSAAERIAAIGLEVAKPLTSLNLSAAKALRQLGIISRLPKGVDGVDRSFSRLVGKATGVDWRAVFGHSYKQAEKQAVFCRALAETDATAFVNATDVFHDLLLSRLYKHDRTLGIYNLGGVGAILASVRLRTQYPNVFALISGIREQRYISNLSHAVARRTGMPTGRISFKYLKTAKRFMRSAFTELAAKW